MRRAFARIALPAAASLMFLGGCGSDGSAPTPTFSSEMTEATVKGTVKVNGKLSTGGMLEFNPMNPSRPNAKTVKATIQPDGTYTVKTLVGGNSVTVNAKEALGDPSLQMTLSKDITAGESTWDIAVGKS